MTYKHTLPAVWVEKLLQMEEFANGGMQVTVRLTDGRVFAGILISPVSTLSPFEASKNCHSLWKISPTYFRHRKIEIRSKEVLGTSGTLGQKRPIQSAQTTTGLRPVVS